MTKRREKPVQNPIETDLIAAAVRPIPPKMASDKNPVSVQQVAKRGQPPRKWEGAGAKKSATMKTRFAASEVIDNTELRRELSILMGSKVAESHITRALWSLARKAGDEMKDISGKAPRLKRPPHGDKLGTAEYEDAVADFLLLALKRTRRVD